MKFMIALAGLLPAFALAGTITGKVIGIADGDTLRVLTPDRVQVVVRLASIDAPEKDQPFGTRSKESLAAICANKAVTVDVVSQDRYGRTVGNVYCGNRGVVANPIQLLNAGSRGDWANRIQLERGMAWVYRQYNRSAEFEQIEAVARSARAGLWADKSPTPPWEWRLR